MHLTLLETIESRNSKNLWFFLPCSREIRLFRINTKYSFLKFSVLTKWQISPELPYVLLADRSAVLPWATETAMLSALLLLLRCEATETIRIPGAYTAERTHCLPSTAPWSDLSFCHRTGTAYSWMGPTETETAPKMQARRCPGADPYSRRR